MKIDPAHTCNALRAAIAAVFLVAFLAFTAGAQVFHTYPGAPASEKDKPELGVSLGFGDDLFRTVGFGRFNVNDFSDIGIEIILDNISAADVWQNGLGADFKYNVVPEETSLPFDLAVNSGIGFQKGGGDTKILVPLGGLLSRPLELGDGNVIVPYGGIYVLIFRTSKTGGDDWGTDVELRGGAGLRIDETYMAFANLHLGAGTGFYLGFKFVL